MAFNVMLCKSMPATDETIISLGDKYWYELKMDGVRGVLAINEGKVTLTNRNGVNVNYRYPEVIAAALDKFGTDARLILDGEVVVFYDGRPSFKHTAKRDRQQKPGVILGLSQSLPASFVAFDLLYQDADLRGMPFVDRKKSLDAVLQINGDNKTIVPNVGSSDGHKLLALVRQHSLEGLIAKRLDSTYRAGKHSDWVKIKPVQSISCVVIGFTAGTGARSSTFGALNLALYEEDGTLTPCGDVGTGFKQNDLLEIQKIMSSSFDNIVVEVEFQEFTVDGALRFPVFKGIRTDVPQKDCTFNQIKAYEITEIPA